MQHTLITQEEYRSLPKQPIQRFLQLEEICRTRMLDLISREPGDNYDETLRLQYMATVAAAAEELGIGDLPYENDGRGVYAQFNNFSINLTRVATKLNLRASSTLDEDSVAIATRAKGLIEIQVNRLRDIIRNSELPEAKKKSLSGKLDQLLKELHSDRASFAELMKIIAVIGVGVSAGTSFLADAPEAITTITALLGQEKEREDTEQRQSLEYVTKALPPPPQLKQSRLSQVEEDDEIPF